MGSVLSKTNENNTGRVTNINIACFNRSKPDESYQPNQNDKSKVKSD